MRVCVRESAREREEREVVERWVRAPSCKQLKPPVATDVLSVDLRPFEHCAKLCECHVRPMSDEVKGDLLSCELRGKPRGSTEPRLSRQCIIQANHKICPLASTLKISS